MSQIDTIVIGAGVSGLATAYFLKKLGQSVLVLESSSRAGGVISSVVIEGKRLELGPNSFLLRQELEPLLVELGLEIIQASKSASSRYLHLDTNSGYRLFKAPSSLIEVLTTKIISPFGKLRVPFEQVVKKITVDLSVHDFLAKRFGPELAKIAETALNGIYAADTTKLSARSALPKLWELQEKFGSVIGGFLFRKEKAGSRPKIVSFKGGIAKLTENLAGQLKDEIRFNSSAEEYIPGEGIKLNSGEILSASNYVIACENTSSSKLLKNLNPKLAELVERIAYVPLGILHLTGEKGDHKAPLEGFGVLKEPKTGNSVLGALYSSSLFPTADSKALLTCFVGGGRNPTLSDVTKEENARQALQELKAALGLGSSFKIIHAHYWDKAIPFYPVGHFKLKEQIEELAKERIFVASNWLERPGLPDCIIRGKEIAERIVK